MLLIAVTFSGHIVLLSLSTILDTGAAELEGFLICISAKGARLGKPAKTRSRLLPMLNSLIKETLKLLHHGFAVHTAHEGGDTPFFPPTFHFLQFGI